MPKVVIYYFTGTGNTRIAAKAIQQELLLVNFEVTLVEIRKDGDTWPDPNDFDIAGFGYPIHAFNAPQFYLKEIRKLAKVSGKKAFVFKTSGEPFGFNKISSWSLIQMLKRKGFNVIMDKHMLMPYNIMFRYKDALAKQMYIHTHELAKVVAYSIKHEKSIPIKFNVFHLPMMYLLRIEWFGARLNGPLFHAKKKICTSCDLCVKVCPTDNIVMKNGIPSFGADCTMCMGCVMSCPVDAIRPGLISGVRINGQYPFKKLLGDDRVSADFINDHTTGYFKLFKHYYDQTNEEISQYYRALKE